MCGRAGRRAKLCLWPAPSRRPERLYVWALRLSGLFSLSVFRQGRVAAASMASRCGIEAINRVVHAFDLIQPRSPWQFRPALLDGVGGWRRRLPSPFQNISISGRRLWVGRSGEGARQDGLSGDSQGFPHRLAATLRLLSRLWRDESGWWRDD